MARWVSLSDHAFAILRRERRPHESDSDAILRLYKTARRKERDPIGFFRHPPAPELSPGEYAEVSEKMHHADRRRWDPMD